MSDMTLDNGRGVSTPRLPVSGPNPITRSTPYGPPPNHRTGLNAASFQEFLRTQSNTAHREAPAASFNGTTSSVSTMPSHAQPHPAFQNSHSLTPTPFFGFDGAASGPGLGAYRPPAASAPLSTADPFASNMGQLATAQTNPMFTDEAFNAAFGEYDDAEFDREIDAWIADHDGQKDQQKRVTEPPTSEEMAVIDADLEVLAEELEARRATGDPAVLPQKGPEAEARKALQDQEDLVRAATEILVSVSDNESDKFKNSSFLDLMRRIQKMEIVVSGNELVDHDTGETVVTETNADGGEVHVHT